ncbi:MAG: CRISPR-associated helicase Cas3' [Spirochaetes bacterium]|nr:CRISPR-associated helicase Cas3' [Spirochaetota bacterium]
MSENHAQFIAHVREKDGQIQTLASHLLGVGELASQFAAKFGISNIGRLTGLWHDLGKYQMAFQERIRKLTGYDVDDEGASGSAPKVDHSSAGGILAAQKFGTDNPITYAIMGHHCGLQDREDIKDRLERKKDLLTKSLVVADAEICAPKLSIEKPSLKTAEDQTFFYRMLFSALIDADRLDTQNFCEPEKAHLRHKQLALKEYDDVLSVFMQKKAGEASPTSLNALRQKILSHANEQASLAPGFFSLTVPTGGGKTLTSLSFALKHCLKHGKERIIYAIPYTSIIEQNADVFKQIFGAENVFEHHSAIRPEQESTRNRLLSENWDFPLIVTTNVQLFESLFSRKTSSCRKLHNIVNSVIIFDEVQTLPLQFLQPVITCLKSLVDNFGVSVVFCTATQPALKSVKSMNLRFDGIDNIREIAPQPEMLFEKLRRVEVKYPSDMALRQTWEDIAKELQKHSQVLCIVNTRRHAYELFKLMPEETIHLSALMCPAHRSKVIAAIKKNLAEGKPIRVVSTQLVEAGVDIDFPVVYRALSGIDNIAQAAGRCNREGKMSGLGQVFVFIPPESSPPGHLYQCEQAGLSVLQDYGDPLLPENYARYYEKLLWTKGKGLDHFNILEKMRTMQFEQIHKSFTLIDNAGISVLVPYQDGIKAIETLQRVSDSGQVKGILRGASRYLVNLPQYSFEKLQQQGSAAVLHDCIGIVNRNDLYDDKLGLLLHDLFYYKAESLIS